MANDVSEIKLILLRWIEEYKNKKITYYYQPMNEIVAKYTRRETN